MLIWGTLGAFGLAALLALFAADGGDSPQPTVLGVALEGTSTTTAASTTSLAATTTTTATTVAQVVSPQDPLDAASTSHQIGSTSDDATIDIAWTPVPGALAYAVSWSEGSPALPDAIGDLPGSASGTQSPELAKGDWYFSLRTQGPNGRWTATVRLGPFLIEPVPPATTTTSTSTTSTSTTAPSTTTSSTTTPTLPTLPPVIKEVLVKPEPKPPLPAQIWELGPEDGPCSAGPSVAVFTASVSDPEGDPLMVWFAWMFGGALQLEMMTFDSTTGLWTGELSFPNTTLEKGEAIIIEVTIQATDGVQAADRPTISTPIPIELHDCPEAV